MPQKITIKNGGLRATPLREHEMTALQKVIKRLAYEVIETNSVFESGLDNVFVAVMGGQQTPACEVFYTLRTRTQKHTAVLAAASVTLPDLHVKILDTLICSSKQPCKMRDKLAHWHTVFVRKLQNESIKGLTYLDPRKSIKNKLFDGLYLFTEDDLQRTLKQYTLLNKAMFSFLIMINAEQHRYPRMLGELEDATIMSLDELGLAEKSCQQLKKMCDYPKRLMSAEIPHTEVKLPW